MSVPFSDNPRWLPGEPWTLSGRRIEMTGHPCSGNAGPEGSTRDGVESDQNRLAQHQMRPTHPAMGRWQAGEKARSAARQVGVRRASPRIVCPVTGSTRAGPAWNWKPRSQTRRGSRYIPPQGAARTHSEPGTARPPVRMQASGWMESAAVGAVSFRQWHCDRHRKSGGVRPSGHSGRWRALGQSQRRLSSFARSIMVMSKSGQVSISSDHSKCQDACRGFASPMDLTAHTSFPRPQKNRR